MRYIGIITIIFEVLSIGYLFADYKNEKMEKRAFFIAESLCCIALIGMVILTVLNW